MLQRSPGKQASLGPWKQSLSRLVRGTGLLAIGAALSVAAEAAPLFPDVPDTHWAKDAVSSLAARGLLEGYPDGTFKGDRASSRFEVAMIVARLLAAYEHDTTNFATKADLDTLRQLANAMRPELEALGVRVTNLEEQTARLDKRVTELERITFYGSFDTRVVAQTFHNDGQPDNDSERAGAGKPAGVPYLNYNSVIGASSADTLRPQTSAVIPVVDYTNGRSLNNGAGFTSKLTLGVRVQVTDDIVAGTEFAAYTSQGNNVINTYWGVSAPYLLNPTTANPAISTQTNTPYTSMVLDRFYIQQDSTHTRLVLGAYDDLRMDRFIYAGQPNLSVTGPTRFAGYGPLLQGEWNLSSNSLLQYEAFETHFGEGNTYDGTNYNHTVFGGDLDYKFKNGDFKVNFSRYFDDAPNGANLEIGLLSGNNVAYGASSGWTPVQWVNPPGYYSGQLSPGTSSAVGQVANKLYLPNLIDSRPIPGWNGATDNAAGLGSGAGNYGPQSQDTYGASARFRIPLSSDANDNDDVRLLGQYGHSIYKPNENSGYTSGGDMGRFEVGTDLLDGNLHMALAGVSVSATYNPAIFANNVNGLRFVQTFNFVGRFSLYDNVAFPQNRTGFQYNGDYSFDNKHATVTVKANLLQQTQTSLYDVREPAGNLGVGIPNFPVLGFSPGFYDPVFSGFASPLQYGKNSASSFTTNLDPLENPRGQELNLGLGFKYQFDDPKLELQTGWQHNSYFRPTSLSASLGGSQNYVKVATDTYALHLNWKATSKIFVRAGIDVVHAQGHHDPAGLYNNYAISNNEVAFNNIASLQTIPGIGIDGKLAPDLTASADFRYFIPRDQIASSIYAGGGSATIGYTSNPFSWSGPQVMTEVKYNF